MKPLLGSLQGRHCLHTTTKEWSAFLTRILSSAHSGIFQRLPDLWHCSHSNAEADVTPQLSEFTYDKCKRVKQWMLFFSLVCVCVCVLENTCKKHYFCLLHYGLLPSLLNELLTPKYLECLGFSFEYGHSPQPYPTQRGLCGVLSIFF